MERKAERAYSPLPEENTNRLLRAWHLFVDIVGLEGDLYFDGNTRIKDGSRVIKDITRHRKDRPTNIELFREEVGKTRGEND